MAEAALPIVWINAAFHVEHYSINPTHWLHHPSIRQARENLGIYCQNSSLHCEYQDNIKLIYYIVKVHIDSSIRVRFLITEHRKSYHSS